MKLSQAKKFAKAAKLFMEAVRIDSQFYEAHVEQGYPLIRLRRYEESINASQQAAIIRSDFMPYYNMGLVYIAQKDWHEANNAFARAIAHCKPDSWKENYSNAYYYSGLSLARLGEAETAIEALEESLEISPEMSIGRFELATLYLGSGKYKDVRAQYRIPNVTDL